MVMHNTRTPWERDVVQWVNDHAPRLLPRQGFVNRKELDNVLRGAEDRFPDWGDHTDGQWTRFEDLMGNAVAELGYEYDEE